MSAPAASHHRVSPVRPTRTTTSAIAAHASTSYGVVLAMCPLPSSTGMVPVAIAASSCARRAPPNSRAVSPPTTTEPAAASAGHSRRPTAETPNSDSETLASSGASAGWST